MTNLVNVGVLHSSVDTLTVPSLPAVPAPVTAPAVPHVWEMPNEGLQWCDCEEGCEVDRDLVEDQAWLIFDGEPQWVSHPNLCRLIQEFWAYDEVCNFFFDHVERSARAVHGSVAEKYPFPVAIDIAGYFSKTWQGCPEESCQGGGRWSDLLDDNLAVDDVE